MSFASVDKVGKNAKEMTLNSVSGNTAVRYVEAEWYMRARSNRCVWEVKQGWILEVCTEALDVRGFR